MNESVKSFLSSAGKSVVLCAAYFLAANLGLKMAYVHANATAVWPPSGLALAAVILWGARVWPGIFLGAFLANLQVNLAHPGSSETLSVLCAAGIALGNTLEALFGSYLVRRLMIGKRFFEKGRDVLRFTIFGATLSPLIAATVGVVSLCLTGFASWRSFEPIWLTWWFGDAVGIMIFAPLILVWAAERPIPISRQTFRETALFLGVLSLASCVIFRGWLPREISPYPFVFLLLPILKWADVRFGLHGATLSILVLSAIAVWGTLDGLGPFALPDHNASLILLQTFIGTISVSALGFAAFIREVKEEETVFEKERELREYIDHMSTMNAKVDLDGRLIVFNRMAALASGLPKEELVRTNFLEGSWWSYDPKVQARVKAAFARAVQGETVNYEENIYVFGKVMPINFSLAPVLAENYNVKYIVAEGRDITVLKEIGSALERTNNELEKRVQDRTAQLRNINEELTREIGRRKQMESFLARQTQDLVRSNAELEQFAYIASHDLQEPLRMVASYTQLLEKRYKNRLDKDADQFIGFAVDGVSRMRDLINDLLDYSRLNAAGKDQFGDVDCNSAFDRAANLLQVMVQERKAQVTSEPLPTVRGDFMQIVELLQNLIANGLKFNRSPVPQVRVKARHSGREYIFSVADNGIGIEPQYLDRIFVIFQRLHSREEYEGTGIGLTICKKIVERHGGRIWAESPPGAGTTFFFALPKGGKENGNTGEREEE